jgi:His-Xaa-Ser system protein HxsD
MILQLHFSLNSKIFWINKIKNEVLDQDLRDTLSQETANIRTLILANAFSNTGLIE